MSRTNLFFKVEVEHDSGEKPERIGEEIGRQLRKLYGVREVCGDLLLRAERDAHRSVEIHGNAREVVCWSCGERAPMERALARVRAGEEDPPCRTCGGILKSATISFGQNLEPDVVEAAERAALACDLMLVLGSKLSVYPAAGVVPLAVRSGARLIIINEQPTTYDDLADVVMRKQIGTVLPALVDALG